MENVLLGLAILGAVYAWYRMDFHLPRSLRAVPVSPRVAVVLAGCCIVLITSGRAVGGVVVSGRTQVSQDPVYYARRDTQPRLFWRQIALELGMGLVVGGGLIGLGRKRRRLSAEIQA